MGDVISTADESIPVPPARSAQHEGSTLRPLALAGAASLGAGAIHAAAIGVHSEHHQAVYAFTAVAGFQIGWGAIALVRSSRWLALVGAAGNTAIFGGWGLAKTSGISFVDGLTEAESVQLADGLAAGLAVVAVLVAISVAMSARVSSARLPLNGAVAALAVAALTVPAMASAGSHTHSGDHAHNQSTASGDEASHVHAAEMAEDAGSSHTHDDQQASAAPGTDTTSAALGILHDHGAAVAVTDAELEAATRLVADTKAGVARFGDLEAAKADGYYEVAPPRNGLVHYLNSAYNRDGRILDPEHPESLIYLNQPDGTWTLVGAMYRMPAPDQPGPRVGGPLTAWHAHNNLCRADGRVVAVATNGVCPKGVLGTTPEMLHVWLVENPDGVFSDDMEPDALVDVDQG